MAEVKRREPWYEKLRTAGLGESSRMEIQVLPLAIRMPDILHQSVEYRKRNSFF